jgi:hypothetical protein
LRVYAERCRGAYLLLRERYSQALPCLEQCLEEPIRNNYGWGQAHGVLARAYNELGRYDNARAACSRVLDVFTPADLDFTGLTLVVETEALIAQAGLGQHDAARAQLAQLVARHAPGRGPLSLGELHEAGVRIALIERDEPAAWAQLAQMHHSYRATTVPTLAQCCETLKARVQLVFPAADTTAPVADDAAVQYPTSELAQISRAFGQELGFEQLAQSLLQIIAESAGCTRGWVYGAEPDGRCSVSAQLTAMACEPVLLAWVEERVAREAHDDTTADITDTGDATALDPYLLQLDGWHYRLQLLCAGNVPVTGVLAAMVIGRAGGAPERCSQELVRFIRDRLYGLPGHTTGRTASSA